MLGASYSAVTRDIYSDRMCGNGSKLPLGRLRIDMRKHDFTERVVRHRNSLLAEGGQCLKPVSV